MTYNFSDDLKKFQAEGLYLSEDDLKRAQADNQWGRLMLGYKRDYANATNDGARGLAHYGAEQLRAGQGYSGGADGSDYRSLLPKPVDYGSITADPDTYAAAVGGIQQRRPPAFAYDADTDDLYAQYRKQYTREGRRATEDTLGAAAAATGGIPSSYAVTAASQAGNYYAGQLADKIPELYQAAYNRYLNELGQYNTERSFDLNALSSVYGAQADKAQREQAQANWQYQQDYAAGQDRISNGLKYQQLSAAEKSGDAGMSEKDRAQIYKMSSEMYGNGDVDGANALLGLVNPELQYGNNPAGILNDKERNHLYSLSDTLRKQGDEAGANAILAALGLGQLEAAPEAVSPEQQRENYAALDEWIQSYSGVLSGQTEATGKNAMLQTILDAVLEAGGSGDISMEQMNRLLSHYFPGVSL